MRLCRHCKADIRARHYLAQQCLSCAESWGKRTGQEKASSAVAQAVARGDLQKAALFPCTDCGARASDYDHRDYNRPLDVQPVCRSCNRKRGAAIPLKENE